MSFKDEIISLQKRYVMPCVETWLDILFVEGRGATLKDSEGREYIDLFAGIAVVNVGHCHPKVVEAIKRQAEKLTHLSTLYYTEPMPRLAEKLSEIVPIEPGKPKKSFFCNSGGEAVETALLLARSYTGRREIISLQCGFHGCTAGARSSTGILSWRRAGMGALLRGVYHAPAYYCYRCPMGYEDGPPECDYACARYVEFMLKTQVSEGAAFIAEPIYGVGGCVAAPPEYFKVVKEILDDHELLLVVDEVQSGFGRTGKWWGIQHYGVEPDMITMAKAIAGGVPLSAVTARSEIADSYTGPHFFTFAGNLVSCAAALATIEVIESEGLVENAERVGGYILRRLREMEEEHRLMADVQGLGLMIGFEVVEDKESKKPAGDEVLRQILVGCAERGVIVGRGGLFYNRVRIEPPLCITMEQAERGMEVLDEVMTSVEKKV